MIPGEHLGAEPVQFRGDGSSQWHRVRMLTVCGQWVRPTHVAVEAEEARCPDCQKALDTASLQA